MKNTSVCFLRAGAFSICFLFVVVAMYVTRPISIFAEESTVDETVVSASSEEVEEAHDDSGTASDQIDGLGETTQSSTDSVSDAIESSEGTPTSIPDAASSIDATTTSSSNGEQVIPLVSAETFQKIPLIDISEKHQFAFGETVTLVFKSQDPFPIEDLVPAAPEEEISFVDTIVDGTKEMTNQVLDSISALGSALSDQIKDMFSFFADDATTTTNDGETPEVSVEDTTTADTVSSSPSEQVEPQVSIAEGDTASDMDETFVTSEATDQVAPTTEIPVVTPEIVEEVVPLNDVRIDGQSVPVHVQLVHENELRVAMAGLALKPGVHTVLINIPLAGAYYTWEGQFIWEGQLVREDVLTDIYRAYVVDGATGRALWFIDTSAPGYEYKLLGEPGTFSPTTLISYLPQSVFWLSENEEAIYEYDIVGRTISSSALEPSNDTKIERDAIQYEVSLEDDVLRFDEVKEEATYVQNFTY